MEYRPIGPSTTGQPAAYGRSPYLPAARDGPAAMDHSIDSATSLLRATQPRPVTPVGRTLEITLRLLGPLLLGLAVPRRARPVKR